MRWQKLDSEMLTPKQWSKLREAVPALRRKAEADDVRSFKAILRFVKKAPTREIVRRKYRNQRSKIGYGTTIRCEAGLVLVAVLENGNHDELAAKVSGVLDLNNGKNGKEELARILAAALRAATSGETDQG